MISVFSSSPHLSLAIPTYASLSLGWSPTHQVPCVSFHDCVFDNLGRACAAHVVISNATTPTKNARVLIGYFGTRSYPVLRFVARAPRAQFRHRLALSTLVQSGASAALRTIAGFRPCPFLQSRQNHATTYQSRYPGQSTRATDRTRG